MIHTRSADRRAGESTDSSDSTASSGRAVGETGEQQLVRVVVAALAELLALEPGRARELQQQLTGPLRQVRSQRGVMSSTAIARSCR